MTKSELIELLSKHKITCKFNNGKFGEIQKCKDVDTSGYGYLNLYDDYDENLNCIYDTRFDIIKIYCRARHEPATIAQYLYEDYNVQKYTNLFRKYVEEHSEPLDWGCDDQGKFYSYYDYYNSQIYFDCDYSFRQQGTIYASSKEILQDAISFVGEENFIKYVIGIE